MAILNLKVDKDGVWVSQAVKQNGGYIFCVWGGVFDASYPSSDIRRGRVQGGGQICPALTSGADMLYVVEKK